MFRILALAALLIPAVAMAQPATPKATTGVTVKAMKPVSQEIIRLATLTPDPKAVAAIRADKRDCPACNLAGANLTNTCVKHGNLTAANFDGANATLMCMSFANFTNASFRGTTLSGANLAHADVDGADFSGADLTATSFKGTDLRKAHGLTQAQLSQACGDKDTKAPAGMTVPMCS